MGYRGFPKVCEGGCMCYRNLMLLGHLVVGALGLCSFHEFKGLGGSEIHLSCCYSLVLTVIVFATKGVCVLFGTGFLLARL